MIWALRPYEDEFEWGIFGVTSHPKNIYYSVRNKAQETLVRTSTLLVAMSLTTGAWGLAVYGGPYKGPPVVPVVLEGGFLADTREVAAARDYHLNVLAKHAQAVKGGQGVSPYQYQQRSSYQPYLFKPQPVYTQAQPYTTSLYYNTGTARNTPYIAPVNEDTSRQFDDVDYADFSHTTPRPDPMVTPRILDNGYIADTPEVDAAKGEHFAAVARAKEMVNLAQQRAAQEKPQGGYSGGDPTGYADEYRSEYSGADYTGFPEYRSDPGYSIRDRTSAGYPEEYPSYSARDRSATVSYQDAKEAPLSEPSSNYPIRDKVLAEAKSIKERSLVKIPAKKASLTKKTGRATATPLKKPVEATDY